MIRNDALLSSHWQMKESSVSHKGCGSGWILPGPGSKLHDKNRIKIKTSRQKPDQDPPYLKKMEWDPICGIKPGSDPEKTIRISPKHPDPDPQPWILEKE